MSGAARSLPDDFEDPFGTTADPAKYVPREATERALEELERAVLDQESPSLLVGLPGIGKTLLLRLLKRRLESRLTVIHLPYAALPPAALANWALSAMNAQSSWDPVGALATRAQHLHQETRGAVLLLIDDAEVLPEETARALMGMTRDAKGGLRFVAAVEEGSVERLAGWLGNLPWVRLLTPMTPAETFQYVHTRLHGSRLPHRAIEAFDPDTLAALHERAGGIPGRVCAEASAIVLRALLPKTAPGVPPPAGPAASPASQADQLMESLFSEPVESAAAPRPSAMLLEEDDTEPEVEALLPGEQPAPVQLEGGNAQPEAERLDDTLPEAPAFDDQLLDPAAERVSLEAALPESEVLDPELPDSSLLGAASAETPRDVVLTESSLLDPELPEPSLLDEEIPALARDREQRPIDRSARAHEETAPPPDAVAPRAQRSTALRRGAQALAVVGTCFLLGLVLGPWLVGRLSPQVEGPASEAPEPRAETAASAQPVAPRDSPAPVAPAAAPAPLRVQINASPWAHIRIDGEEVGVTPLADVPVDAGSHTFEARFPDGRVVERVHDVGEQSRWVVFQ